ncbi:MAG: hypothetical protein ABI670_22830 [Chloroflexota bacterium]
MKRSAPTVVNNLRFPAMPNNLTGCMGDPVVRCPICAGYAQVDDPFSFYSAKKALPDGIEGPSHVWGGRLVVEKYPSVAKWTTPEKGEGYKHNKGVVRCAVCHHIGLHEISWPNDAYYRWDIRGNTLWACNREHAEAILSFLSSKERDETRYPGFEKSLRKLPTEFITAKVRDDVVKAITRTLAEDKRAGG